MMPMLAFVLLHQTRSYPTTPLPPFLWFAVLQFSHTFPLQLPHEEHCHAQQLRPHGRRRRRRRMSRVCSPLATLTNPCRPCSSVALKSRCCSYAETMDDEPDVMNDTALRSVVRYDQRPSCRRFASHSLVQLLRPLCFAVACQHHPCFRRQSASARAAFEQQAGIRYRSQVLALTSGSVFSPQTGSKPLKMDTTDFDD
jgi:hypothetical protein